MAKTAYLRNKPNYEEDYEATGTYGGLRIG